MHTATTCQNCLQLTAVWPCPYCDAVEPLYLPVAWTESSSGPAAKEPARRYGIPPLVLVAMLATASVSGLITGILCRRN